MTVIHNITYNPRIDFIICKQLILSLPFDFDELKLRESFYKESGTLPHEKDIVKIKNFFINTDITKATAEDVQKLYSICTNKEIILKCEINKVDNIYDLEQLADFVVNQNCEEVTLFQILMLFGYCKYHDIPIMPYHGICAKIYFSLLAENLQKAERGWFDLLYRKNKYCKRHTLEQNTFCLSQLSKYKDDFIKETGALKLGVYGSLARGAGSEYSDIDIFAVVEKDVDVKFVKKLAYKFWADKVSINYDVCVTTKECIPDLPVCIKNTIKYI